MYKVSIIVPIYNTSTYISRCVESLLSQTFNDIQFIFVNDATPDNSIEILTSIIEKYPKRQSQCVIVNHKQNKGLTAARNTGLSHATGEYILHCDSDDWLETDMVEKLYNTATTNRADVAICDFKMVFNSHTDYYSVPTFSSDKTTSIRQYITSVWTVIWNILAKRSIYIQNALKSPKGITYGEDFNLSVKLLLHADKIVNLHEPLYNYNKLNEGSIMHKLNLRTMQDEQNTYLDVIKYFKNLGVYNLYNKELCWRVLKSTQEWILDTGTHKFFLEYYPESHQYILSCPYLNIKQKIMMWCLTHHLALITNSIILLRNIKNGKKA